MGKKLHRLSFYTLILAVYGVFFSIESFYNFEGHSEFREIITHSSRVHAAPAEAKVSVVSYPGSHKVRLRLNKRYHQEEFHPCAVYEVVAPVFYETPCEPGTFVLGPLPSIPLAGPQLRGPPSAA
ncbi:MAG TPA: hypothetical protein VGM89_07265 [Puia sp.]|jgi:hypothetical protein